MKHNKIIITATCLIALFGVLAVATLNQSMLVLYSVLVTAIFTLVAIGGIIDYNRIEARDIRDIYMEKIKIIREKNEEMAELIIEKEKELINLRGKICQNTNTANREHRNDTRAAYCIP